MEIERAFGFVLSNKRRALHLSQEQLGFQSGYHRTYISQIERGLKSPSLRTIVSIAKALQTTASELVREAELINKTEGHK